MKQVRGGVTAPTGFTASGMRVGIKKTGDKKDLALIWSEKRCAAAACYTTNKVVGQPLVVTKEHLADGFAQVIGSWRFIIIQTVLLALWIALNVTAVIFHWDPYPFILLNLAMSFQAAYAAPILMMSQNRHAEIEHLQAHNDYEVNLKAELEIEQLHQKFDALRDQSWVELVHMQQEQIEMLQRLLAERPAPAA